MKDFFAEMHDLIESDQENSEWSQKFGFKKRMEAFLNETNEIKEAIENDDLQNLKEEIGDTLWNLIYAIYMAEKEGLFTGKEVFEKVIEKIKRRKPWAVEGKKVSREEELRIWNEVKEQEKMNNG